MEGKKEVGEFTLCIDFQKDTSNPTRIFRAADEMIRAFQQIDASLVRMIDPSISSEFLLHDIQTGSLKVTLRKILEAINEDALKKGDWKGVIGPFLNSARCVFIKKLNEAEETPSRALLEKTSSELQQLAVDTDVRHLPDYAPLDHATIADHLWRMSSAKSRLSGGDAIIYETPTQRVDFNMSATISSDYFDEALIKETISTPETMILKVKKPDYLGTSQWQFVYQGHIIEANIFHAEWLDDFQNKRVQASPGDALRVKAIRHTRYSHDNELVDTKFDITQVIETIPAPSQGNLL